MLWKSGQVRIGMIKTEDEKMRRISRAMAIVITVVMMIGMIGTYTADAASKKAVTWKIKKTKSGYVTKFYDNEKLNCTVWTKKKLAIRAFREDELADIDLTGRYNKYIVVEFIEGKCINNDGDGVSDTGYYISYKRLKNHKKGTRYHTFCIYDNSKYIDDIIGRIDHRR